MFVPRRKKPKRNVASNHPGLGIPKGEPRADRKRRERDEEIAVIVHTHELVWERDVVCRLCHGERACWLPDQMHELVSRAQTRGLPADQRFSTVNCVRLCADCHRDVTENRIDITWLPDEGADGTLYFMLTGETHG